MNGVLQENLTVADVPSVNALWSLGSEHEFVLVGSTAKRLEMFGALSFINTCVKVFGIIPDFRILRPTFESRPQNPEISRFLWLLLFTFSLYIDN